MSDEIKMVMTVTEDTTRITFVNYQLFVALQLVFLHDTYVYPLMRLWYPEYGFLSCWEA